MIAIPSGCGLVFRSCVFAEVDHPHGSWYDADMERYLVQHRRHGGEWQTIRLIGDHSEGLTLEEVEERVRGKRRTENDPDVRIAPVTSYEIEVGPDPREDVWIWGNRGGDARWIGHASPD